MNFEVAYEILENSKLGKIVTDSPSLLKALEEINQLPIPDKQIIYNKYNLLHILF